MWVVFLRIIFTGIYTFEIHSIWLHFERNFAQYFIVRLKNKIKVRSERDVIKFSF